MLSAVSGIADTQAVDLGGNLPTFAKEDAGEDGTDAILGQANGMLNTAEGGIEAPFKLDTTGVTPITVGGIINPHYKASYPLPDWPDSKPDAGKAGVPSNGRDQAEIYDITALFPPAIRSDQWSSPVESQSLPWHRG